MAHGNKVSDYHLENNANDEHYLGILGDDNSDVTIIPDWDDDLNFAIQVLSQNHVITGTTE